MSRIDEIVHSTDLTDAEKCRLCIDYLDTSGTGEDYQNFANSLIDAMTLGYMKYKPNDDFVQIENFRSLKRILQSSSWMDKDIYFAFVALHENDRIVLFRSLQVTLKAISASNEAKLNCDEFIYEYVIVFKNAFPGFWAWLGEQISTYKAAVDGIAELCATLELFYYSHSSVEIIDNLLPLLTQFPDVYLADELLGYTYFEMKLWKNAIAFYERAWNDQNRICLEYDDVIAFKLGWAYVQVKNNVKATEYYEEALRIFPEGQSTKNNLGICLLQTNRLDDALRLFDECIKENRDIPHCYNNKVRTLIAMGKAHEALAFAQENAGRGRVGKGMAKQAETAVKRGNPCPPAIVADAEAGMSEKVNVLLGVPKQQFSSERILEDELTMRLERGVSTFDMKLRVYEQTGDYYGRQYPISGGRIDILATDDENNLYAIELKKDGGYGDVYKQMQGYLTWLRENKAKGDQKVFGIICLNNPSEETIHKVQLDNDIRLFEYSIAYKEIN